MGVGEFVAAMAALMALNALAIDVMLPALKIIGSALGAPDENATQQVVVVYVLGFGTAQLVLGPLTDWLGRRSVLFVALGLYTAFGAACMFAADFEQLLIWRFLQGAAAAGVRVIAVSVVRDIFAGRGMARIMSFIMTVFMIVPILAPGLGQLILFFAPWQWTFGALVAGGVAVFVWMWIRLKETLPADKRTPISPLAVARNYREVFTTPVTLGYMLASGVIFGALFAFIASSTQIFVDTFGTGEAFPLWVAGIAIAMTVSNLSNAQLVERLGMRFISHFAVIAFTALSVLTLVSVEVFGSSLAAFYPLFVLAFACFGLIGANFTSLAMEPLGRIAGTGSAVHGFFTTSVSGAIGGWIGAQYDGTVAPLLWGYVGLGLMTLVIVLITEKGRLFSRA